MGRSIITAAPATTVASRAGPGSEAQAAPAADGYSDALMKLIPAEVIGVYIAMQSILINATPKSNWVAFLVVFMFGVFATYFYLRVSLKVTNKLQLGLSVGAFCVWAYSMVPPECPLYNGTYAGLLLIAYTFIAPKISLDVKS
ncbi:MAG: hypothetical protein COB38_12610 [Gammaproteobacteria bacterium]|nr:MAG: hypothetical protein COB38_12610 [Gammaproteobacteria bacterium]